MLEKHCDVMISSAMCDVTFQISKIKIIFLDFSYYSGKANNEINFMNENKKIIRLITKFCTALTNRYITLQHGGLSGS